MSSVKNTVQTQTLYSQCIYRSVKGKHTHSEPHVLHLQVHYAVSMATVLADVKIPSPHTHTHNHTHMTEM